MSTKVVQEINIGPKENGFRLDVVVADNFGLTRTKSQSAIAKGLVLANNKAVKKNYKVSGGDVISLQADVNVVQKKPLIHIIYEDDSIVIINKPSGISAHPAAGEKDATVSESMEKPVFIVHRLDKGTSGVMILAKTKKAALELSKLFKERAINKTYIVLVSGTISEDEGSIQISLGRSIRTRGKIVPSDAGKQSATDFKVLKRYKDFTLVSVFPKTGRTHQIRTHFAAIGHPLYGDIRYGGVEAKRIFLHAEKITFYYPTKDDFRSFTVPLPKELADVLDSLL